MPRHERHPLRTRTGLGQEKPGVHPICRVYFVAYMAANKGEPPGRSKMAAVLRASGGAPEQVHRDWRSLKAELASSEEEL